MKFIRQVAANLLRDGRTAIKEDRFWPMVDELERRYENRDVISTNIWSTPFKLREPMLLFPVQVPEMGDRTSVQAKKLLRGIALSEAKRVADMKRKRAEITLESIISRLERLTRGGLGE
ncbi:MAG: hypothetical protein GX115_03210 [Ruminiclostridium sp.]|nr:hypothetical protein [Ruminiclostridium sp.]